jgi:hypothetical protein
VHIIHHGGAIVPLIEQRECPDWQTTGRRSIPLILACIMNSMVPFYSTPRPESETCDVAITTEMVEAGVMVLRGLTT